MGLFAGVFVSLLFVAQVTTAVGPCALNSCQNGGQCVPSGTTYSCTCPTGFSGSSCEINNLCASRPCLNGGVCSAVSSTFTCTCAFGYDGDLCEHFNPCASKPCRNGGLCQETQDNTYVCGCALGYVGHDCETYDPCASLPCGSRGQCIVDSTRPTLYYCVCQSGFTGDTCELSDVCAYSPCLNGGLCLAYGGTFKCMCEVGFTGTYCGTAIAGNICVSRPCQNGGHCALSGSTYSCTCAAGYTGSNCQTSSPCSSGPCKNGAQCVVSGTTYTCTCTAGFTGSNCDIVNPCASSPCKNGAQCVASGSTFACTCTAGFTGPTCEIKPVLFSLQSSNIVNTQRVGCNRTGYSLLSCGMKNTQYANAEILRKAQPVDSQTCECYDYFGMACLAWCTNSLTGFALQSSSQSGQFDVKCPTGTKVLGCSAASNGAGGSESWRAFYPLSDGSGCRCYDYFGTNCVASCGGNIVNQEVRSAYGSGRFNVSCSAGNFVLGCGIAPDTSKAAERFREVFAYSTTSCQCYDYYGATCYASCGKFS